MKEKVRAKQIYFFGVARKEKGMKSIKYVYSCLYSKATLLSHRSQWYFKYGVDKYLSDKYCPLVVQKQNPHWFSLQLPKRYCLFHCFPKSFFFKTCTIFYSSLLWF